MISLAVGRSRQNKSLVLWYYGKFGTWKLEDCVLHWKIGDSVYALLRLMYWKLLELLFALIACFILRTMI